MNNGPFQRLVLDCLAEFYRRRLQRLQTLKLKHILSHKNPYLYKSIGCQSATEIVEGILRAFLTSSDEGIFGDVFFEPIAKAVSKGIVSPSEGVDIAIETGDRYLAIAVKSGPNPFNSSQTKRQNTEFMALRSRLQKIKKQFDPLLGHCYGKKFSDPSDSRIFRVRSGQAFWEELTGDRDFYSNLLDAIDKSVVDQHRQEYETEWEHAVNRYVREFTNDFCDEAGAIDWHRLLEFNSGKLRERGRANPASYDS